MNNVPLQPTFLPHSLVQFTLDYVSIISTRMGTSRGVNRVMERGGAMGTV